MAIIFLFECDFEIGNKTSHLKVYKDLNNASDIMYLCLIDNDEEPFYFVKCETGEWSDAYGGVTNLSEKIGDIIEKNHDVSG